jgi:WD40 repeat protein/serine/threonine protein kinase
MMNEPSPERVKEVFNQAMGLPPEERDSFLDRACGSDTSLRHRVERLLKSLEEVGPFLASPTGDIGPISPTVSASTSGGPVAKIGTSIGPYKLLQEIGEGGFGVVYMAEQERPVRRRVALKIIKLGMDTKQVIARFEAERQALAMMEHPNIARVLDAGATETGRPYFVMELVKGVPITEYCDSNRLSTADRLHLFMQVCSAVQHAHQKGIIHRDIKPSNVMVTLHDGAPVTKVIDFGISKATHQRLTEKTLFTQYGQFIGTPVYMSPEQAEMSGLDSDTRSDIYSLGVLLYELLTGTTPFDAESLRRVGYAEIQRIIREEEPPTPSTRLSTLGGALTDVAKHRRTDASGLSRLVRGDLDWIVMKALEKDRTRRYASASGFAEDIARHLGNEPVVARPQSAAYKMKKFVRRHRGPVAAVAAIVATIIVLGSLTVWQARVAQRRAHRIWVNSVLASASETDDPLIKALVALELADLPEHPGRLALAREAADHPLPLTVIRGHTGVELSPDGTRILTITGDGTAWIWPADGSGAAIALRGAGELPCGKLYCAARFSPDGTRVLAIRSDGTARLWRADDGKESVVLRREKDVIDFAAFSPDGRHVVTRSEGGTLRMWQIDETESSFIVGKHDDYVMSAAFSPDGTRLLVCYQSTPPRIWRTDGTGEPIVLPHGEPRPDQSHFVHNGAFSPDGTMVITGSRDGIARVWRGDGSGSPVMLRHDDPVGGRFSPDGDRIITATWDGTAWIWPADGAGKPIALRGHSDWLSAAAFSPDGTRILTASKDGTARLWRADDPEQSILITSSPEWIIGAAFSPDGTRVFTFTQDEVRIWRADDTGEGVVIPTGEKWASADMSADGSRVVTGSYDGTLRVWRADGTGEPLVLGSHHGPVQVEFSPDGTRVLSSPLSRSAGDGTVRIWPIDGTEEPAGLRGHENYCIGTFSPDGSRVLTRGGDGFVKLWRADGTGEPVILARPEEGGTDPASIGFLPNGSKLILLSNEGEVQVASIDATGSPPTFVRHEGLSAIASVMQQEGMSPIAFSRDGKRWAAKSKSDHTVKVWRVDGVGEPIVHGGHTAALVSVSFSPDGTLLATTSVDGTARVWRADGTGEPLILKGHGSMVTWAEFSTNGTRLFTVGEGPPRLRRVTWPALREYLREKTGICLTPEQRIQYLVETPDEARAAHARCERQHGRTAPITY